MKMLVPTQCLHASRIALALLVVLPFCTDILTAQYVDFDAARVYVVGNQPLSVAVADFNGDGIPDLPTPVVYGNEVSILLGKGDGRFQRQPLNFAVGRPILSPRTFPYCLAMATARSSPPSTIRLDHPGPFS